MGLLSKAKKTTAQLDGEITNLLFRAQSAAAELVERAEEESAAAQAEIDALTRQIATKHSYISEIRERASRVKFEVLGEIDDLFDAVEDLLDGDDEEATEAAPAEG